MATTIPLNFLGDASNPIQNMDFVRQYMTQKYGPDWASMPWVTTMEGLKLPDQGWDSAASRQTMAPNSTGRWMFSDSYDGEGHPAGKVSQFVPWGQQPNESDYTHSNNAGDTWTDLYGGWADRQNPFGWDTTKYGNANWYDNPSDQNAKGTLPDGTPISQYEQQLISHQWPQYSGASHGNFLTADKAIAIASMYLGGMAGAGAGGSSAAVADSLGSQAGLLAGEGATGALTAGGAASAGVANSLGSQTGSLAGEGATIGSQIPATATLPTLTGPATTVAPATGGAGMTLSELIANAKTALGVGSAVNSLTGGGSSNGSNAGSPLSNFLGIDPSTGQLLGQVGSSLLGAYNADQTRSAYNDLADKYLAVGAPSRARLEASYAPGFTMGNEPGYKDALDSTLQGYLRKASVGGNPFENPGVSQEILKGVNANLALPALQNYRSGLTTSGQIGLPSAYNSSTQGIQAGSNVLGSLGAGIGQATTPQSNLESLLSEYMKRQGNGTSSSIPSAVIDPFMNWLNSGYSPSGGTVNTSNNLTNFSDSFYGLA